MNGSSFIQPSSGIAKAWRQVRWPHHSWRFPALSVETLILLTSLFFSIFCNSLFWSAIHAGRDWSHASAWLFGAGMFTIVTALHCMLLGLFLNRWTAKPLLTLLFVVTSLAVYYMNRYTVFFDASMIRNVLHTDLKEAHELLSPNLLGHFLLYGVFPIIALSRVQLKTPSWRRAFTIRLGFLFASLAVAAGATVLVFQDLSSLMRNQKEVRYLVTPSNYLISTVRVLASDTAHARAARTPVGTDAKLAAAWTKRDKPALLVVVVGETARAANWGLNGYARQTTPMLAQRELLNFLHVDSCGTNTEVSVPCMFSPFGRHDYDETKIRGHESLLHVLEHAGVKTIWRDNQSGCKGVCDGLEQQRLDDSKHATLCDGERCLDEILLENLDKEISKTKGNLVLVLHQLGNHGPAYSSRYPAAFRRFTPTCETPDLGKCTREEIVNSYDNALLYTDHFLDQTIRFLNAQRSHDAAMIYVSDHGESLGESGIYLHGLPYAIAPKAQTEVPMVMWMSNGFSSSFGLNTDCLKKAATKPISHDYLFNTVLGMLQVETATYNKSYDFTANCRG